METKERPIVDSVDALDTAIRRVREAEALYARYTQEQVDAIFRAAAIAANQARIPLAKLAVEETGMGVVEDKVIKNNYAAEYIYNAYRNTRTCGVIEEDKAYGMMKIAAPLAVTASILVDTLSVQDGIGQIIVYSLAGGGALGAFWPAVVLGALLGVIAYNLVTLAEYIFVPWDRNNAGGGNGK